MGKASSSKKVARAKKAAGRPGAKKSYTWPLAIGSVVVVGVLLVVLSAGGRDSSAEPPLLRDHWHAAFGIYDCDTFIPPLDDVKPDDSGIHSHGDGLMHMHPFGTRYTGKGANIEHFGEMVGLEVSDTSIRAPGIERENGDDCGGEEGVLQLWTWDAPDDEDPTRIEDDFGSYAPADGSMWVLAFMPEGAEPPKPPAYAQAALRAPVDVVGPQNTIPPESVEEPTDDTTDTTAAGESTEPEEAPSTTVPPEPTDTSAP